MDDTQVRMLQLASQGYTCSQIIIQLGLEMQGVENPDLVRAMAGLAYGCGSGRATCGALSGGCCLLALMAGEDSRGAPGGLPLMLEELTAWFDAQVGGQFGGIVCETITGEGGPNAARQRCGAIVADTFARVLEILAAHDVNPYDAL